MNRSIFARLAGALGAALLLLVGAARAADKPNIVIVLADDMGWRDTGFSGNPIVKTPHLDRMAAAGLRFDYFYPGGQMCSPGRFAIMTGRSPCRTGLHHLGAMRPQEITVAEALKTAGYGTGHFGKWHLGEGATLPVRKGFDRSLWQINFFDLGAKLRVGETQEYVELKGDTSVATMDLALEFIRQQVAQSQPFFAYVCFGSPHSPHIAADEFKALYKDLPEKQQNYWGEVSGVDAAVGRLRDALRKLKVADNTLVWFTSDNGGITKDSMDPAGKGKGNVGVRTVGLLEWPARVKQPVVSKTPCAHMDIYPTLLDLVGVQMPNQPPLDGVSLVPLLEGKMPARPKPLGFMLWNGGGNFAETDFVKGTQGVLIDGPYKLVVAPEIPFAPKKQGEKKPAAAQPSERKDGPPPKQQGTAAKKPAEAPVRLFDIFADPAETTNLAEKMPEVVGRMRAALDQWRQSVRDSFDGKDYAKK